MADDNIEEEDTIKNPDFITKYKQAADIVNQVIPKVMAECTPGKLVKEICAFGDNLLLAETAKVFVKSKLEKGIAFPTCVSVNNCVGHFSPLTADTSVLQEGDVVKIDLGVHLDGAISSAANTVVCTANKEQATQGRKADVICAAYYAAEAALRLLKPGRKNTDVTEIIEKVCKAYNCTPVEGVVSHEIKKFIIDGSNVIHGKMLPPDQKMEVFEFQENTAYILDIIVSTGDGKAREGDFKTTVFKRAVENQYQLKVKASRYLLNDIQKRFPCLPFSLRLMEDENRARMGIQELVTHELVTPYPVLFEKPGEFVAQFKTTVLITPKQTDKLNTTIPPFVTSQFQLDAETNKLLASGLKRSNPNKKKKKATDKPSDGEAKMEVEK